MLRTSLYRPWIVPVGGFLGAGKTSLILAAARILQTRGTRAAAILNDQGHDLVDTAYTTAGGIPSDEVAGACFCCRFSELIAAADRLRSLKPDVIFIEPVGSCTDLAATLLRPLQQDFLDYYQIAPLTVLIDPDQVRRMEIGLADSSVKYLFEHQLAEADIVIFSKSDLPTYQPDLLRTNIRQVSAVTGAGVSAWLDEVLSGEIPAGISHLSLDYGEYAAAEAALAWLNWSAKIDTNTPVSPAELVGPFLENIRAGIIRHAAHIAHAKMLAQTEGAYLKAALTSNEGEPSVEGDITASPCSSHRLRVNIRAVASPQELESVFLQALEDLPGKCSVEHFQCFSPAAPIPERRIPPVLPL